VWRTHCALLLQQDLLFEPHQDLFLLITPLQILRNVESLPLFVGHSERWGNRTYGQCWAHDPPGSHVPQGPPHRQTTTWSSTIILSIPLQVLPRLTTTELCSDTKKEGPENLHQWRDLPRTLVFTFCQSTSNPQTPNLSWLGLSSCHRSRIYLQLEDWQTQQRITRHNTQLWSYITHRCLWGKMLGHHSWIIYIVWERKHCPQTQFLTDQRRWLSLQFFLSLSLYVLL